MCKTRAKDVREIPIHFGLRERGASKLTLKQQFRYLETPQPALRLHVSSCESVVKFLIATGAGWALAAIVYALLIPSMGMVHAAHRFRTRWRLR
jgi:hypothetical protein